MLLVILMKKKFLERFTKKICKKKEDYNRNIIKRIGGKLYVTWNDYSKLFNRWIDKKRQFK